MNDIILEVNRIAPLKNVVRFSELLDRLVNRGADEPGLGCFYGFSGLGKTKAATFGANQFRAAYIEVGQYTSAKGLLQMVLMELGLPRPRGSIGDMVNQAIERLSEDPRRPLIVDEAHFIAAKKYVDLLRELHDKSLAPVIMIGEQNLPGQLEAFERVHNRILVWAEAAPVDLGDVRELAKVYGEGLSFDDAYLEACIRATRGNARRIIVNINEAKKNALLKGACVINLSVHLPKIHGPKAAKAEAA